MCKFHKDVARAVSKQGNPKFRTTKYTLALASLSMWWVEHFIPSDVEGYNSYELATESVQAIYTQTRPSPLAWFDPQSNSVSEIATALDRLIIQNNYRFQFSEPKLQRAIAAIYRDDEADNAIHTLRSLDEIKEPKAQALAQAVLEIHNMPKLLNALKLQLEQNIDRLFQQAPGQVNPWLLRLYQKNPAAARAVSLSCACGANGILPHFGCVASSAVSLGTAGGAGSIFGALLGTTTSLLGVGIWTALRWGRASKLEKVGVPLSAALGLAIALGVHFHKREQSATAMQAFLKNHESIRADLSQRAEQKYHIDGDMWLEINGTSCGLSPKAFEQDPDSVHKRLLQVYGFIIPSPE